MREIIAFLLTFHPFEIKYIPPINEHAEVAELADALRSGRSELTFMRVQVPPSAQKTPHMVSGSFYFSKRMPR
jgi:hypothetical protein